MNGEMKMNLGSRFDGGIRAGRDAGERMLLRGFYRFLCRRPDGTVRWVDGYQNLIMNEGLDHVLSVVLAGGSQVATWYLGLIDGTTPTIAAGDTLASKAWSENQAYGEANRATWTPGAVSGQSVDNSGAVASFSINANGQTISGGFLASDNTKGGTSGVLYSAGTFTGGDKGLDSGDTLEVTATFTNADDGV